MTATDRAAGEQAAVVLRDVDLSRLAAQRMDARVERPVAAARGVDGQRADHQRRFEHRLEREQRVQPQRGAGLRAVDQRQALLRAQHQRRDACLAQHLGGRPAVGAGDEELAFAEQRQRHVRERREVAGGADAALARHVGHEAGVVHREQAVDDGGTHARVAARQARRLRREHQPHDRRRQRRADTDAVRADQVQLQRREVGFADPRARQLAEAGVDAVDRGVAFGGAAHDLGAGRDRRQRLRVDVQLLAAGIQGVQVVERQGPRPQQHQRPTIGRFSPCSCAHSRAMS